MDLRALLTALVVTLLAACSSAPADVEAGAPSALPEVRYYMIADT